MTTLVEKVLALSEALTAAGVDHAFGGAIALAYCTEDPRGTRDIDVNAFVPASEPGPVLAALPPGVRVPPKTADVFRREGQVRLWWDDTPVDLFLDYAPLHAQAAVAPGSCRSRDGRSRCWGLSSWSCSRRCSAGRRTGWTSPRWSRPERSMSYECARTYLRCWAGTTHGSSAGTR